MPTSAGFLITHGELPGALKRIALNPRRAAGSLARVPHTLGRQLGASLMSCAELSTRRWKLLPGSRNPPRAPGSSAKDCAKPSTSSGKLWGVPGTLRELPAACTDSAEPLRAAGSFARVPHTLGRQPGVSLMSSAELSTKSGRRAISFATPGECRQWLPFRAPKMQSATPTGRSVRLYFFEAPVGVSRCISVATPRRARGAIRRAVAMDR